MRTCLSAYRVPFDSEETRNTLPTVRQKHTYCSTGATPQLPLHSVLFHFCVWRTRNNSLHLFATKQETDKRTKETTSPSLVYHSSQPESDPSQEPLKETRR